jgi:hypothetical protein
MRRHRPALAEGVKPEPHIDILTVKAVSAPAAAAPSQESAQQSAVVVAAAVPVAQSGSKTAVGNSTLNKPAGLIVPCFGALRRCSQMFRANGYAS